MFRVCVMVPVLSECGCTLKGFRYNLVATARSAAEASRKRDQLVKKLAGSGKAAVVLDRACRPGRCVEQVGRCRLSLS